MKLQEHIHLALLIGIFLLGVHIGRTISEPHLEVVARNSGECTGCGSKTIVEIKKRMAQLEGEEA